MNYHVTLSVMDGYIVRPFERKVSKMKLYPDTENELTFDDFKPLPSLSGRSLPDLYELQSNLEAAQENACLYGSDLLAIALDMDLRKVDTYIRMYEQKQNKH